jgi:hypothetical protein
VLRVRRVRRERQDGRLALAGETVMTHQHVFQLFARRLQALLGVRDHHCALVQHLVLRTRGVGGEEDSVRVAGVDFLTGA